MKTYTHLDFFKCYKLSSGKTLPINILPIVYESVHFTTSMPALDITPFTGATSSFHLHSPHQCEVDYRAISHLWFSSLAPECCLFISVFHIASPEVNAAPTDKCWSQAL